MTNVQATPNPTFGGEPFGFSYYYPGQPMASGGPISIGQGEAKFLLHPNGDGSGNGIVTKPDHFVLEVQAKQWRAGGQIVNGHPKVMIEFGTNLELDQGGQIL